MEISAELKKLAEKLDKIGKPLYIVGGYVRDFLCGKKSHDIDICSNCSTDAVIEIATKLNYKCKLVNKKLGTIHISTKNETWEYTAFRKESYSKGHSPENIVFVDDIKTDAKRRDLTINAIYYNIKTGEIVDPLNGKQDLINGILRTANDPMITLKDDGLRILRIIRFASTLGFQIEKNTMKALKTYRSNLREISKERILAELNKMVTADLIYYVPNKHLFHLLNKLDLYKYMFVWSLSRMRKPSKEDIYNFYNLNRDSRLMALYLIIIKNMLIGFQKDNHLQFLIHSIFGVNGIKESKENIRLIIQLYSIFQNLQHNQNEIKTTLQYLSLTEENKELISNFLDKKHKTILVENILMIQSYNLPTNIRELAVSAKDLQNIDIKDIFIGKILDILFTQVTDMKIKNQKEELLELAKTINETFTEICKTRSEK